MSKTIIVKNIDVDLLRSQRDLLLLLVNRFRNRENRILVHTLSPFEVDLMDGLINALDTMLDSAEGY